MRFLRRLEGSTGHGLLEVLIPVALFVALVAVAVPAYLGFQNRQAAKDAEARLLAAVPAAEAYRSDNRSYTGMNSVSLLRIDPRISPTLTVAWARRGAYCLTDTVRGRAWSVAGPHRGEPRFIPNTDCA